MILTKDAKTVLFTLYKEYVNRKKSGTSKLKAKNFDSANSIQENFFPKMLLEDVEDSLRELERNDFLNNFYADNTIYFCSLSDSAIALMESQTKETLLNIADFIAKFIP